MTKLYNAVTGSEFGLKGKTIVDLRLRGEVCAVPDIEIDCTRVLRFSWANVVNGGLNVHQRIMRALDRPTVRGDTLLILSFYKVNVMSPAELVELENRGIYIVIAL